MDDVCDPEARAVADGFEEGKKHGIEQGRQDARTLGVKKGLEIGRELGHMLGCIVVLETEAERNPDFLDPKHLSIAAEVKSLIEKFPVDPQDPDLQEKLSRIRSRFKILASGVKVLKECEDKNVASMEF